MEFWGRDHISTLTYAETRVVDYGGVLEPAHMRRDGNAYPSYLANGEHLKGHTDYDCLRDAEHFGLLHFSSNAFVEFTDAGWQYVQKLRRDRAERNFKGIKADVVQSLVETAESNIK
jgi:hypothetical protein